MTPQQFNNYMAGHDFWASKGSEEHHRVCVLKHSSPEHMTVYRKWLDFHLGVGPAPIPTLDHDDYVRVGDQMFQQAIQASRPLPEPFVPDY